MCAGWRGAPRGRAAQAASIAAQAGVSVVEGVAAGWDAAAVAAPPTRTQAGSSAVTAAARLRPPAFPSRAASSTARALAAAASSAAPARAAARLEKEEEKRVAFSYAPRFVERACGEGWFFSFSPACTRLSEHSLLLAVVGIVADGGGGNGRHEGCRVRRSPRPTEKERKNENGNKDQTFHSTNKTALFSRAHAQMEKHR